MPFVTLTRYGAMQKHADDADVPQLVGELLEDLETEEFDEADDEHVEIGISYGDWGLSVEVSGLMVLQDMREETLGEPAPAPALYQWATDRGQAARLLQMIARGDIEAVRADSGWVPRAKLPAQGNFSFRVDEEDEDEEE